MTISARVGTGFRGEAKPYAAPRLVRFTMSAAHVVDLSPAAQTGDDVWARVVLADGGGALIAYQSNETEIELPAAEFDAYLRLEGLDAPLAERARRGASAGPGRERYARCAKTWIGGTSPPHASRGRSASPLEIVPLADPHAAATRAFASSITDARSRMPSYARGGGRARRPRLAAGGRRARFGAARGRVAHRRPRRVRAVARRWRRVDGERRAHGAVRTIARVSDWQSLVGVADVRAARGAVMRARWSGLARARHPVRAPRRRRRCSRPACRRGASEPYSFLDLTLGSRRIDRAARRARRRPRARDAVSSTPSRSATTARSRATSRRSRVAARAAPRPARGRRAHHARVVGRRGDARAESRGVPVGRRRWRAWPARSRCGGRCSRTTRRTRPT